MSILTKTEFANLAGVTQALISRMLKTGKLVEDGDRLDTDNPVNAGYLARRQEVNSGKAPDSARYQKPGRNPPRVLSAPRTKDDDEDEIPGDSLLELEIGIKKQKKLELTLKNAEKIGTVADRSFVMAGFFRPCETLFTQLLGDFVKSCAGTIIPMAQGGSSRLEIESKINQLVSNFLKPCKARMEEAVRALHGET